MYQHLSRGDMELLLRCLDYSKKNISEQKIDPDEPEELRAAALAWRKEELDRVEELITKLRFMRDRSE